MANILIVDGKEILQANNVAANIDYQVDPAYPTMAQQIDDINEQLCASNGHKFEFMTDGDGNYGYRGADDSFIPFKSGIDATKQKIVYEQLNKVVTSISLSELNGYKYLIINLATVSTSNYTKQQLLSYVYYNDDNAIEIGDGVYQNEAARALSRTYIQPITSDSMDLINLRSFSTQIVAIG